MISTLQWISFIDFDILQLWIWPSKLTEKKSISALTRNAPKLFFIYWYTLILLVIVYNVYHNTATTKSVNLFPNSVELHVFLPWCNLWMINVAFHIFSSADQSKTFFNQIIKNVCLALMQPSKARCGLSYFKQNQSINQSMRARLSWECCIKTQENTYSLQNLLKKKAF